MSNSNESLLLSWPQRIDDLRHATGFPWRRFSRLIKLDKRALLRITQRPADQPYFPSLKTIRKIRFFEEIFAADLALYRSNRKRYDRLQYESPKRVERWVEYEGVKQVCRMPKRKRGRRLLSPIDLTQRPSDLAALGGMEAYRNDLAKAEGEKLYDKLYINYLKRRVVDLEERIRKQNEVSVEDWVEE